MCKGVKCPLKQLKKYLLILFGVVSLVVKHKNYESFSLKSLVRIRYYPSYFIIINSNKMGVSNEIRCSVYLVYYYILLYIIVYIYYMSIQDKRINIFKNNTYKTPSTLKKDFFQQPILNKVCLLINNYDTYQYFLHILYNIGEFTDKILLIHTNDNSKIINIMTTLYKNGFRVFFSDHDDNELISISTFKYIDNILVFNSISTQDLIPLHTHIVRSSVPDYNYIYFILINIIYSPVEAVHFLSMSSEVNITKLIRQSPVFVNTLVFIHMKNNYSNTQLDYINVFNNLMGSLINVINIEINIDEINVELDELLSNNIISNDNYTPTLFLTYAIDIKEANDILNVLYKNPINVHNYFVFNDEFLNIPFLNQFEYAYIIARNYSKEGNRLSKYYEKNTNSFNYSLYDMMQQLMPMLSSNYFQINDLYKKLLKYNYIVKNHINNDDIMSYFHIKQTYIYTITPSLEIKPSIYRYKFNPTEITSVSKMPIYENILFKIFLIKNIKSTIDGNNIIIHAILTNNISSYYVTKNKGMAWKQLLINNLIPINTSIDVLKTRTKIIYCVYNNDNIYISSINNNQTIDNIKTSVVSLSSFWENEPITNIYLSPVLDNQCIIIINNKYIQMCIIYTDHITLLKELLKLYEIVNNEYIDITNEMDLDLYGFLKLTNDNTYNLKVKSNDYDVFHKIIFGQNVIYTQNYSLNHVHVLVKISIPFTITDLCFMKNSSNNYNVYYAFNSKLYAINYNDIDKISITTTPIYTFTQLIKTINCDNSGKLYVLLSNNVSMYSSNYGKNFSIIKMSTTMYTNITITNKNSSLLATTNTLYISS